MASKGATATFFVLANAIQKHSDLIESIRRGGHEIGIHGVDHSHHDFPGQAAECSDMLQTIGVDSRVVRPPGGHFSAADLVRLVWKRYRTVLWSLDSLDSMRFEGKHPPETPDYCKISGGDIVLMHDDNPVCVQELPTVLDLCAEKGLETVTVSSLLA